MQLHVHADYGPLQQQQHVNACLDGPLEACPSRDGPKAVSAGSGQSATSEPHRLIQPRIPTGQLSLATQRQGQQGQLQQPSTRQLLQHHSSKPSTAPNLPQPACVSPPSDPCALSMRPRKHARVQNRIFNRLERRLIHGAPSAGHASPRPSGTGLASASSQHSTLQHSRSSVDHAVAADPACILAPASTLLAGQHTDQMLDNRSSFSKPVANTGAVQPQHLHTQEEARNSQQAMQPGHALTQTRDRAGPSAALGQSRPSGMRHPYSHEGQDCHKGSNACGHMEDADLSSRPLHCGSSNMRLSLPIAGVTAAPKGASASRLQHAEQQSAAVFQTDKATSCSTQAAAAPAIAIPDDACHVPASPSYSEIASHVATNLPRATSQTTSQPDGSHRRVVSWSAPQAASQATGLGCKLASQTASRGSQPISTQGLQLQSGARPLSINNGSAISTLLTGSQRMQAAEALSQVFSL